MKGSFSGRRENIPDGNSPPQARRRAVFWFKRLYIMGPHMLLRFNLIRCSFALTAQPRGFFSPKILPKSLVDLKVNLEGLDQPFTSYRSRVEWEIPEYIGMKPTY